MSGETVAGLCCDQLRPLLKQGQLEEVEAGSGEEAQHRRPANLMPSPQLWPGPLDLHMCLWGSCAQSKSNISASAGSWEGAKTRGGQGWRRRKGGEEQLGISKRPGSLQS